VDYYIYLKEAKESDCRQPDKLSIHVLWWVDCFGREDDTEYLLRGMRRSYL